MTFCWSNTFLDKALVQAVEDLNSLSLCLFQAQLQRTCSAACCVFLARVQCCSTPTAPPSQRPRARPGAWRSFPVTPVRSWAYTVIVNTLSFCFSSCLHFHDGLRCVLACILMFVWYTTGWEARCGCTAFHRKTVWVHLLSCVCTSFRADLCVPVKGSSGFPGVFAPVVEQWGRRHGDSSCPQSHYMVPVLYLARRYM